MSLETSGPEEPPPPDNDLSGQDGVAGKASSQDIHFSQIPPETQSGEATPKQQQGVSSPSGSVQGKQQQQAAQPQQSPSGGGVPSGSPGAQDSRSSRAGGAGGTRAHRRSAQSQRTSSIVSHGTIREADVLYKRRAPILQNPLAPPRPDSELLRHRRGPGNNLPIMPGPARHRVAEERHHYYQYRAACPRGTYIPNPAAATPMTARPNPHTSAAFKKAKGNDLRSTWAELEEQLKDRRDHVLAEEIGYETLVGNLLYIDIVGGRDINRSWQNFLSEDVMEWGFPYYKGSRERPRVNDREPYLAHQLKEKLWRYPKTRIFHAAVED